MRANHSCLAIILTLLLSCTVTGVPHEDYDSSEVDISVLTFYLEKALDHLDRSLELGSAGDVDGALSESEQFRSQVQRADRTLHAIPEWVDSYSYLNEHLDVLSGTERNLSMMMENLRDLEIWFVWLDSFSVEPWTFECLSENLTRLDIALISIPDGIGSLRKSAFDLGEDIRSLKALNLSVPGAEDDITSILAEVEADLPDLDPRPYLGMVIAPIMEGWASDLGLLSSGSDPMRPYVQTAMVLERSSVDLSGTIKGPIDTVLGNLEDAGLIMDAFREDQIGFLYSMGDLKHLIAIKGPITLQMASHDSASRYIDGMFSRLLELEGLYLPMALWDHGGVKDGLSNLGDLLAGYRMELDSLDLVFTELEDLGSSVQMVLSYNVLLPDEDLDGSLSDEELLSLVLPDEAFDELERSRSVWQRIRSIVDAMEHPFFEIYGETVSGLGDMVLYSDLITRSHEGFLGNVSLALMSVGPPGSVFLSAIEHLSNMEIALEGVRDTFDAFESGSVGMDPGVVPDLGSMMGLYEDAIERILLETGFDSTIVLSLDRDIVPYDGSFRIQVNVMQRTEAGIIVRPSGTDVNVLIDGIPAFVMTLQKGKALSSFRVPREMELGYHSVLANLTLDEGMAFIEDRSAFEVRRMITSIRSKMPDEPIGPGEDTSLSVVLRDEFDRVVEGEIELDGGLVSSNGTYDHVFTPMDAGPFSFEFVYDGDEYHLPVDSIFTVNVTVAPVMDLMIEKEVVKLGDPINHTLMVRTGSGGLTIRAGDLEFSVGRKAENGSVHTGQLDSSLFGEGMVLIEAHLTSDRQWCRDGVSETVSVMVLTASDYQEWLDDDEEGEVSPPIIEPPETPQNETPIDSFDPPPEDTDTWEVIRDALTNGGWIWVSILLAVATSTLLISAVLRRKKGSVRAISLGSGNEGAGAGPVEPVNVRRAVPGRYQGLVNTYVEVIETSPQGSGLRIQMTPREVSKAIPSDSRATLVSFESKVYDPTSPEDDDMIIRGLNGFRNWLSIRFGPGRRRSRP